MILIHTDSFFVKVILAPSDLLLFWCILYFRRNLIQFAKVSDVTDKSRMMPKAQENNVAMVFSSKISKILFEIFFFIKHTILIFECFGRHSAQLFYFCWSSKYSWEPEQKHSGELFRPQAEKSAPKFRNVGIFCGLSTNVWWLWVSAKTVLPGGEKPKNKQQKTSSFWKNYISWFNRNIINIRILWKNCQSFATELLIDN